MHLIYQFYFHFLIKYFLIKQETFLILTSTGQLSSKGIKTFWEIFSPTTQLETISTEPSYSAPMQRQQVKFACTIFFFIFR